MKQAKKLYYNKRVSRTADFSPLFAAVTKVSLIVDSCFTITGFLTSKETKLNVYSYIQD